MPTPRFTASVDAALALVERCLPPALPGWRLSSFYEDQHWHVEVMGPFLSNARFRTASPSYPLAILAALLRALLASHPAEPLKQLPA